MTRFIFIYLLIVNVMTFILYGIDKYKAKHHHWRISERTLFTLTIIGGAIGALLAMYIFRHKTKTPLFKWGVPLVLLIQILIYFLLVTQNFSITLDKLLF